MDLGDQADEAWLLSVQRKLYQWSRTHPEDSYPDPWKPSFHQKLQYVFCISTIRFLLPHVAGTNLRRVPDTYLVTQLLQQLHEPLIVSYGFNAYDRWRSLPIEAFGFSTHHQLVFFGCSSIRIQHGDLLKARVKITTYYDHSDSFLPLTLVSKPTTVYRASVESSPLSNQPLLQLAIAGLNGMRCALVLF